MKEFTLYDDNIDEILEELKEYISYIGPSSNSGALEHLVEFAAMGSGLEYLSTELVDITTRDLNKLYKFFKEATELTETKETVTRTVTFKDLQVKGKEGRAVDDIIYRVFQ